VPSRSLGTSIGTWPLASANTVFRSCSVADVRRLPLRLRLVLVVPEVLGHFLVQCSFQDDFRALFELPARPGQRQALLLGKTHQLRAAAAASADGSALFFVTSSSVVITAPPSLSIHSASRAETPINGQPRLIADRMFANRGFYYDDKFRNLRCGNPVSEGCLGSSNGPSRGCTSSSAYKHAFRGTRRPSPMPTGTRGQHHLFEVPTGSF